MKKSMYYLSVMLLVACFTQPAAGQFEGKITYSNYVYSGGEQQKNDEFNMFITPERIMLQGGKQYDFLGSIKTEGVLVRLDFEDFVFLTGNDKALKISKSDITSMMNMFSNRSSGSSAAKGEVSYEQTGEKQTIQGYDSEKFILKDKENNNIYTEVWMTRELDIQWGMLAEPWGDQINNLVSSEFPIDMIFKKKYFPVKVETYKNDELIGVLEAEEISQSPVARAMVQVPSGLTVLSFQDYLFQQMSNN